MANRPKILFVDDEPNILSGIRRMLRNQLNRWDLEYCNSGPEAISLVKSEVVDFVISDMRMPGMDGAQLLHHVKDLSPNTVRIVLSGQSDKDQILECVKVAHQYFSKPCVSEDLVEVISRVGALRNKVISNDVRELAANVAFAPSRSNVIGQLKTELAKEEPNSNVVRELVAQDIGLSVKLIQIVSSSFFGERKVVYEPARAASLLGSSLLQKLIDETSIVDESNPLGKQIEDLSLESIAIANSAKAIAQKKVNDIEVFQQVYLSGLLTNVGKMILMQNAPEKYADVMTLITEENAKPSEAEIAVFGHTHLEVGGYMLGIWGLPVNVIEGVFYSQDQEFISTKEFHPALAVNLAAADLVG